MGCSSNKEDQTLEDMENQKDGGKNNKKKNIKIEITEDPEKQGEKFHMDGKDNNSDFDDFDDKGGNEINDNNNNNNDDNDDNDKKDSFEDI